MLKPIRRLTAGFNNSTSTILSDEIVEAFAPYEVFPHFKIQELFYTEDQLQSLSTRHYSKPYDIQLPPAAMRFMTIQMPTIAQFTADLMQAGQPIPDDWASHFMHRTDSVDYLYVLSGSVTYVTRDKSVLLKQGDFLAQIGPEHAWINNSDEPCTMLCVMVGIKPKASL